MPGQEHPAGERDHDDEDQSQGTPRPALTAGRPSALLGCCHLLVSPCPTAPRRVRARAATKCSGDPAPADDRTVPGTPRAGGRATSPGS
ncbi:putative protein-export membrane protein SecD [Streptomyces sp. HCCB10043]|nr:putative protein-export membrane protein SecD [Streptomyces sp. HCCB10043]